MSDATVPSSALYWNFTVPNLRPCPELLGRGILRDEFDIVEFLKAGH